MSPTDPAVSKEELRELIANVFELPVDEVTDEADFVEQLEADSLMALEVAVRMEKLYGIRLADSEVKDIRTLNKAHEQVLAKLAAAE